MQRLKKMLSLVLTVAMLLSFGAIGVPAGAAVKPADVVDWDDVEFPNAVEIMMALGVLTGYPEADGKVSFQNDKTLTRAELAIVVAKILNGGVEPVLDKNARPDFSDVPSPDYDWAAPYIFYCVQQGILSGDAGAGGTFRPGDEVTIVEAAKCILVAIGYRADIAEFIGPNWVTNVTVAANSCDPKLFNGLANVDVRAPLTRGWLAQIIFNAIKTDMKTYDNVIVPDGKGGFTTEARLVDFKLNDATAVCWTMLSRYFGADRVIGVVRANEFAGTFSGRWTTDNQNVTTWNPTDYNATIAGTTNVAGTTYQFSSGEDMLGLEVEIFTKLVNNKWIIYGNPIITENNTIVDVANGAVINTAARQAGITIPTGLAINLNYSQYTVTRLDEDQNASYVGGTLLQYVNAKMGAGTRGSKNITSDYRFDNMIRPSGIPVRLVDNNNDGTADFIFVSEQELDIIIGIDSNGKVDFRTIDDVESYDVVTDLNLAKDDIVLVTNVEGVYYITEPETVEGTITSISNSNKRIVVDGTTRNVSDVYSAYSSPTSQVAKASGKFISGDTVEYDTEYMFYLDIDGNVIIFKELESGSASYILIVEALKDGNKFGSDAYQVRGYLADGSAVASYSVNMRSKSKYALVADDFADKDDTAYVLGAALGDSFGAWAGANNRMTTADEPIIARYTTNSEGVMTLYDPIELTGDIKAIDKGQTRYTGTVVRGSAFVNNAGGAPALANNRTVVFFVTRSYDKTGTFAEYKFSAVKTGATNIPEILNPSTNSKDPAMVGIYDRATGAETVLRAMLICTDSNVAGANDAKYAYVSSNVFSAEGGGVNVYKIADMSTNSVVDVTVDGPATAAGSFATYYADGRFTEFDVVNNATDDYQAYYNARVSAVNGTTVSFVAADGTLFSATMTGETIFTPTGGNTNLALSGTLQYSHSDQYANRVQVLLDDNGNIALIVSNFSTSDRDNYTVSFTNNGSYTFVGSAPAKGEATKDVKFTLRGDQTGITITGITGIEAEYDSDADTTEFVFEMPARPVTITLAP